MKAALWMSSLALAGAVVVPDVLQRPLGRITQAAKLSSSDGIAATVSKAADQAADAFKSVVDAASDEFASAWKEHTHHGHQDPHNSKKTIYELIHACPYTSRFAKLVDEHASIVKLLNETRAESNVTLFVPVDKAFEDHHHGHHGHDFDDKEATERLLRYHIGLGEYPALRILGTNTLPTALDEAALGGEAQRLRTSIGLGGVEVNFYSKVVAADFRASNGVIHGVNHLLVPPPFAGRLITMFPSHFSTLLLAYEKTNFVRYVHDVPMPGGSTLFAPSNGAFARLGEAANGFLFNTETGHKCLTALLKYHVVPNATLYSDAYYDHADAEAQPAGARREHYELKTLFGDSRVSADVLRWAGFAYFRINGFAHVSVRDGVAANGVVQVLDRVLIPPYKHRDGGADEADNISVDHLKARLEPYL